MSKSDKNKQKRPIQIWGKKVNWRKRVRAVCKPCWEIKYCPFGPLVENFPISRMPSEKSCRIFGHDCPVFYVAEPFTETKELRNISRKISRTTQFRVLKRDNQICFSCGNSVKDQDVEFDHIIPWSKGGSSDEHNVNLLCKACNRKKGKKYEDKYLIKSLSDHIIEPAPFEMVVCIIEFVKLFHEINREEGRIISAQDICGFFGRRKVTRPDEAAIEKISDIAQFFNLEKQNVVSKKQFNALKYRWGFHDGNFYKLSDAAKRYNIDVDDLLIQEAE